MRWKIRRPSEPKLFFLSTFSRWILFLFLTQTFSSWPYHYFPQLFSQLIILGWIRNTLLSLPQSHPECPVGVQFIIQSAHDHSRSHLRVCAWVCGCVWVRRYITETSKFFIHPTTKNETLNKFRPTPTPNYRRLAGPTHARLVISFPTLRVKISFHTHDMQQKGSLCG